MTEVNPSNPTMILPETIFQKLWYLSQRLLALLVLLALVPLFVVLYIAIKLTSHGPFLYRQVRPGLGGRLFKVIKIRSMTVGADKDKSLAIATNINNPQITKIGRKLRDLKLDELPQLWNVVMGDMALVGPRPIAPALHDKLCQDISHFNMRLSVRPGLTNIGQVSLWDNRPGEDVVEDWRERFEGEWLYLQHRSVIHDVILLAMTVVFMLRKALRRGNKTPAAPVSSAPKNVVVALVGAFVGALLG
jgi:lipopolysaccharide/colanic/teichoic acid biosynthesis glycosyltransferase